MIEREVRAQLLRVARASLVARVRREAPPLVPADVALQAFGVFVTLYHRGQLRGCLGALDCREPIVAEVARLAAAVSHEDPRFTPLGAHELDGATLDLSVLTPPEPVADHAAIEIGRHGLIVEQGWRKGLLLPQVAPEHGWDRATFLAHTCLKAGLSPDAWQRGATVLWFEAEVFGES